MFDPALPVNVAEYEPLARARTEPALWDFYAGYADDGVTMRACRSAFEHVWLRPRGLVNVSQCDTTTAVLGTPVSMPILIAPTAWHTLAHPDGEPATARAAGAAGTLMVVSEEFRLAMALSRQRSVAEIDATLVRQASF